MRHILLLTASLGIILAVSPDLVGGERNDTCGLAPVQLAWFDIAWPKGHGAPPSGSVTT